MGTDYIQVLKPNKTENQYLSRQSGVLTSINSVDSFWTEHGIYPDLETVFTRLNPGIMLEEIHSDRGIVSADRGAFEKKVEAGEFTEKPYLRKITLPDCELANLRQLLLREGISKAHMMPTFDNVASTALNSLIT